jgi:hypothetical protein
MDGILGGIGDFFSNIFGGGGGGCCGDDDASGAKGGLSARAGGAKDSIMAQRQVASDLIEDD